MPFAKTVPIASAVSPLEFENHFTVPGPDNVAAKLATVAPTQNVWLAGAVGAAGVPACTRTAVLKLLTQPVVEFTDSA